MKFTLFFFVLAFLLIQTHPVPARHGLDIKTSKTSYQSNEKIYFDTYNKTSQDQDFYIFAAERQEGNLWTPVRTDITCACRALCKRKPYRLAPYKLMRNKWNQKDSECFQALPGTYRITIMGPWDAKTKKQLYMAISNRFEIN